MLDDLLDKTADCLFWWQRVLKPLDQRARRVVKVSLKRLGEQRMLVAVGIVETRRGDSHFGREFAHRCRFIAALPKTLDRLLQRLRFVKFPRSRHSPSRCSI